MLKIEERRRGINTRSLTRTTKEDKIKRRFRGRVTKGRLQAMEEKCRLVDSSYSNAFLVNFVYLEYSRL